MACQPKPRSGLTALLRAACLRGTAARPWLAFSSRRSLHTTIVNETDHTIVLRPKYRDVWEGERVTLESRKSAMVSWTPELYKSLGALVDRRAAQDSGRPLLISNSTMGENEMLVITNSSCRDALQVKGKVKRSRLLRSL